MKAIRLVALAAMALAACTTGQNLVMPDLPAALRPAADQRAYHETLAVGVQVYECVASAGWPGAFEWKFVAPEATLTDRAGRPIGRHYAGPTWEAPDGSRVVGEVKARSAAPEATAIPWLLLAAKSNAGVGAFTETTAILRVETVGGVAPADGCDAQSVGRAARVPYKATYYFYRPAMAA
jgi:hypothetical protein